nr:hypothetical protein [Tanacetum cinerariifolium]
MSSASSAVTYTSVYTDSKPGRVFWGADEELSDEGSLRVIVYGYDQLPMLPVAPPSPDYTPGPEEPQTPPRTSTYFWLRNSHCHLLFHLLLSLQGDDGDGDDGNHLDMTLMMRMRTRRMRRKRRRRSTYLRPDSVVVIPIDELASPPEGTEPIIPPPFIDTATTGAMITNRPQTSISLLLETEVERLLAMPTPSPLPFTSLSPPSAGERLARCTAPTALPSPPLPPSLYPPHVDHRDDIPEFEQPPPKRLCLSTLGSRYEVGESYTKGRWVDYGFSDTVEAEMRHRGIREVVYGIRDAWIDLTEAVLEMAPTTLKGVNTRVINLAELHEHDT